jgi:4-hydroxy-3-methylbut-2-enyl diphosphate reductase
MQEWTLKVADCLGFCGGVKRAMELFRQACRENEGRPVYVLHELVHNLRVTAGMKEQGARFTDSPEELPPGATVLIGAHGIAPGVEAQLRKRAGKVIDATCPLVKQVQAAAAALTPEDELVFHGLAGHPEAEGILGRAGTEHRYVISCLEDVAALPELERPALLAQTTLNHRETDRVFAALQKRFPNARRLGAICSASFERQNAVEKLVPQIDALVVIGSDHSSNANRLREIGSASGIPSWLVDDTGKLPPEISSCHRIGLTAGASTPPEQIEDAISAIRKLYGENDKNP